MTTRWPSRYRAFLAISLICLVPSFMTCQTGQQLDELSSTYKGKIFLLRNFYSGTDLEYDQNYMLVRGGVAGPWTLAGVRITQMGGLVCAGCGFDRRAGGYVVSGRKTESLENRQTEDSCGRAYFKG